MEAANSFTAQYPAGMYLGQRFDVTVAGGVA
jgi:hypothetical protein